ncbi:unnamed protein product [Notodromas monacha]|uniref:DUF7789 domain-containing protein n=1 Tax=Notodromas monacha TaxID=399045 RepID=A0A7R9GKQ0_9CRUS|nr:unnamed protein product [Notodromas monacha]CAG0925033.1 unnamed protein product [Notodromas monacha]
METTPVIMRSVVTRTRLTMFGRARRIRDISCLEWMYVTVGTIGILITIALTMDRLLRFTPGSNDFLYAILLLVNALFCLAYLPVAVIFEQASEMVVFVIASTVVLAYVVINFVTKFPDVSTINGQVKLARLALTAVLSAVLVPGGLFLAYNYNNSNSLVFRTVGATQALQVLDSGEHIPEEASMTEVSVLQHDAEAGSLAWSQDGVFLAVACSGGVVQMWKKSNGGDSGLEYEDLIVMIFQDVKKIIWHPKRNLLVSAGFDGTIKFHMPDGDSWLRYATLRGHQSIVWCVAFDASGDQLVSCGEDRVIKVWHSVSTLSGEGMISLEDSPVYLSFPAGI